jgi:diadenosine tetraphosphate (Ap4A) HIT family hydrolase
VTSCVFCEIVAGRAPASFVHRDERVAGFMDIRPVNPGHLLVVPAAHAPNLADVDPVTGAQMFTLAQRLAAAVRTSGVRCDGVNLLLADGAPAGQEVFHAHLHVIPRFAGDGFGFRFARSHGPPPSRGNLDRTADAIRRGAVG